MNDWKAYARARDQIYSYKVRVRMHHESISPQRRTPQLIQLMEMVDALVDAAATAWAEQAVLVMQLDHYVSVPLPGFEDLDEELKKPHWDGEA